MVDNNLSFDELSKLPPKERLEKAKTTVTGNLFDNPMVRAARKSMTPEQIEEYKRKGEKMYGEIDYTQNFDPFQEKLKQSAIYIISGLKSGLRPNQLSKDELEVLKQIHGETWYINYGYTKEDLK
jgi:hypothetical protein